MTRLVNSENTVNRVDKVDKGFRSKPLFTLLTLFTILCCNANAQTKGFNYYANLDSVKQPGFYTILLTPELNAHLKTDYSDLRIVDDSGKWVPHIIKNHAYDIGVTIVYMNMPILEKADQPSSTKIVLQNDQRQIDFLLIEAKNTSAERFCNVTGSFDQKNWYAINDSIKLTAEKSPVSQTSISYRINFPVCDYRYFKILINNQQQSPINILNVSTTGTSIYHDGKLRDIVQHTANPFPQISQVDSNSISYVKIDQRQAFHFDNFSLKISGVKYYDRTVDVYIPDDSSFSNSNPGRLIKKISISNNSNLYYEIPKNNAKVFYLLIHNNDNPPVKIDSVTTFSDDNIITAYLDKEHYRIIVDNPQAVAAVYDLEKIDTALLKYTSTINYTSIKPFNNATVSTIPKNKKSNWLIWIALSVALVALIYFSKKMLSEVDKTKMS